MCTIEKSISKTAGRFVVARSGTGRGKLGLPWMFAEFQFGVMSFSMIDHGDTCTVKKHWIVHLIWETFILCGYRSIKNTLMQCLWYCPLDWWISECRVASRAGGVEGGNVAFCRHWWSRGRLQRIFGDFGVGASKDLIKDRRSAVPSDSVVVS